MADLMAALDTASMMGVGAGWNRATSLRDCTINGGLFTQIFQALSGVTGDEQGTSPALEDTASSARSGRRPSEITLGHLISALANHRATFGDPTFSTDQKQADQSIDLETMLALLTGAVSQLQSLWPPSAQPCPDEANPSSPGDGAEQGASGRIPSAFLALPPGMNSLLSDSGADAHALAEALKGLVYYKHFSGPGENVSGQWLRRLMEGQADGGQESIAADRVGNGNNPVRRLGAETAGEAERGGPRVDAPSHERSQTLGATSPDLSYAFAAGKGFPEPLASAKLRATGEGSGEVGVRGGQPNASPISAVLASGRDGDGTFSSHGHNSSREQTAQGITLAQAPAQDGAVAGAPRQASDASSLPTELSSFAIVEQIVSRARLVMSRGRAGLNIQLEPKELGKVRIQLSQGPDGLLVKLAAEASDTREIIQSSLPQLKSAFETQGLRVERFDVVSGAGFSGFTSQHSNSQDRPTSNASSPLHYAFGEDADTEIDDDRGVRIQHSLVDYRI
ncbi:MAG: flagellar hook-length control protein FliK [Chloroflexi bacterium]|nr:flagellar hook-length control protein FliK [Chloroflexota bacterium]